MLKSILDLLQTYSGAIQAAMSVLILITIVQTGISYRHSKNTDYLTLRAYLLPSHASTEPALIDGTDGYAVKILFSNSGQTPATDISYTSYFKLRDGSTQSITTTNAIASIGPGKDISAAVLRTIVSKIDPAGLSTSSGNSLVVEYSYKTYQNKCYAGKAQLVFYADPSSPTQYSLDLVKQDTEKEIPCK